MLHSFLSFSSLAVVILPTFEALQTIRKVDNCESIEHPTLGLAEAESGAKVDI